MGYNRGTTDRLLEEIAESFEDVWRERADLADKVEQLEADLVRFQRARDTAAHDAHLGGARVAEMKEQARREADLILSEAHAEARKVQRDAIAENERLIVESRRIGRSCVPRSRRSTTSQDAEDAATAAEGRRPEHLAGRARSRIGRSADVEYTWNA